MTEDPESSSFLSQAYKIAKFIAVTVASFTGFIISLVALDVSKGHWWMDVKFPLYAVAFAITAIVAVFTFAAIWLTLVLKRALDALSYYRSKSKNLEAVVSTLRDLAYNDSITGIPNSNKLKLVLEKNVNAKGRCLILLDLKKFGEINKAYNHWIGDEYLRRFAQMVSDSGRRNEFLFKRRPPELPGKPYEEDQQKEVTAFRKNSGGDEFFILLEGSTVDGLGYLNRLIKRAGEFEQMALDIMGRRFPFGFYAGVITVAYDETYESASKRVAECLGLALEEGAKRCVYWIESELPENITAMQRNVVEETVKLFGRPTG